MNEPVIVEIDEWKLEIKKVDFARTKLDIVITGPEDEMVAQQSVNERSHMVWFSNEGTPYKDLFVIRIRYDGRKQQNNSQ